MCVSLQMGLLSLQDSFRIRPIQEILLDVDKLAHSSRKESCSVVHMYFIAVMFVCL